MKSCSMCPSRLEGDEVREYFGKDFGPGVQVCAVYGHVLSAPNGDEAGTAFTQEAFAEKCDHFGEGRPSAAQVKGMTPHAEVMLPAGEVFVTISGDPRPLPTDEERAQVNTCRQCAWLVDESTVANELGWYLPLCAMSGRLVMPGRLRKEPKTCQHATPGSAAFHSLGGMTLRPEYDASFGAGTDSDPTKRFIEAGGMKVTEPSEYDSDKPVTEDEQAMGVCAWRKFLDPEGSGRHTFLPIFRTDFFDDIEQSKIPTTGSDSHPEWYVDHAELLYDLAAGMWEMDETPILIGEPGTGKTELFNHLAWLLNIPFDRISITKSSEIDDLAGKWLFEDGETRWHMGRIPTRWQMVGMLLLDEPNVGPDEVWQFIRPLTDNSKQLVLDMAKGQKIERNPFCFLGMAINPAHDIRNVGANEIGAADGDRLLAIEATLPPDRIERQIIAQRCLGDGYEIEADLLDTIMKIAGDLREMASPEVGTLPVTWGLRPQIKVARCTRWFGLEKAYRRALVDRLDPMAAEEVLRVVRGYIK